MLHMDTVFLVNYLLVVDSGSIAEAARRLDLTSAAVAQQIHTLEREFGAKLLARSGRTVRPTPAGHRLIDVSRPLLRGFEAMKAVVSDETVTGELRLGTINTALHSIIPDVMAAFTLAFPQVKVLIRFDTSMALFRALQANELDAAICLHPPFSIGKSFAWAQLREEPLVVLAPQAWSHLSAHELLRGKPLIRYDRNLGGGKQADRYLQKHRIVPVERFELNSLIAIAMMVERELGVSLMPDIASPLTASLNVKKIALPAKSETRRFGVLWPRGGAHERVVQGLISAAVVVMQ
jgi:DNA-binding transcriptional LysR family regulator